MTQHNTQAHAQPGAILRPAEAARYLGVSPQTVYRWAQTGSLPRPIKMGPRSSGWRLHDLEKFLEEREQLSRGGDA